MEKFIHISFFSKDPDEYLAECIYHYFHRKRYNVMLESANYRNEVSMKTFQKSNYFIVLLSEFACLSEYITQQIQSAFVRKLSGDLILIPIKIQHTGNFCLIKEVEESLVNDSILHWNTQSDTNELLSKLNILIESHNFLNTSEHLCIENSTEKRSMPLVMPGGNISLYPHYYIDRSKEQDFLHYLLNEGAVMRIKGPRQFGKTSLVSKVLDYGRRHHHQVIPINFQQLTGENLKNLDSLLKIICSQSSKSLNLPVRINDFWEDPYVDVKMKCTQYIEYLLKESEFPILMAIDEVDRIFDYKESSYEFFGMLRYWHESRIDNIVWRKFKLVIAHSSEVFLSIDNINQSPFNVGIEQALNEFSLDEVKLFMYKHDLSLSDDQLKKLMDIVGGHPFLIHKAFYEIKSGNYTFDKFLQKAHTEDGPYSDHLKRHYRMLSQNSDYSSAVKELIKDHKIKDLQIYYKFLAAGLIKGNASNIQFQFKLYELFLKNKL